MKKITLLFLSLFGSIALFAGPITTYNETSAGACNGSAMLNDSSYTNLVWKQDTMVLQTGGTYFGARCAGNYHLVADSSGLPVDIGFTIGTDGPCTNFGANAYSTMTSSQSCTGTANAYAYGSPGPFNYFWQPSGQTTANISNLCAGTYTVQVSDTNGCMVNKMVTVVIDTMGGNPCSGFSVNTNVMPETIFGGCNGSANAYTMGGVPPYNFSWSNGATTPNADSLCVGSYTITVTDYNNCTASSVITVISDTSGCFGFDANFTTMPETGLGLCNGSANAYGYGGTAPYSYNWSNGDTMPSVMGLCGGMYTLIVSDVNGCSVNKQVYINTDTTQTGNCAGFNVFASAINASSPMACDGSAMANVNGGMAPYTYYWAPGGQTDVEASGLCTGNYTVTVTDANGCTSSPYAYVGSDSSQTGPCAGIMLNAYATMTSNQACTGTASANVTGAPAVYTLSWTPGGQTTSYIDSLCSGPYYVFYNDSNGCTLNQQVWVNIDTVGTGPCSNFMVNAYSTPTSSSSCTGTADAYASGSAGPFSYTWMPGAMTTPMISGLCAGTYTVTASDTSGCSATKTVTIMSDTMQNPCNIVINVLSVSPDNGACNGTANIVANGGMGGYTFNWMPNGATTPMVTGLCAGSYSVTVMDANNCSSTTQVFVVLDSVATNPCLNANLNLSIVNVASATYGNCDGFAAAMASGGYAPYTFNWGHDSTLTSNNAVNLCPGGYFVSVIDDKGCVASAQFVVAEDTNMVVTDPCKGFYVTVSGNSTASNCDGSATANVIGGTLPFNYLWSTQEYGQSIANLCPGVYQVSVFDANGCKSSSTGFFVFGDSTSQLAPLNVYVSSMDATDAQTCDGSAVTYVTGGLPPYTYMYSDSSNNAVASSLCPNFYSVTVTDANGASVQSYFVIAALNNIFVDTSSSNPFIDSVIVAEVTTPADEDCNLDYNAIDSVLVTGYTLSGDTLIATWTVYFNGNHADFTSYYSFGPDGVYTLVFELYCDGTPKTAGATGSMKAKDQVLLSTSGIAYTAATNSGVKAYPVPFNNILNLSIANKGLYNVSVYDVCGKQVMNDVQLNGNAVHTLDLSTLNTGYYMVKLQSGNTVNYIKVIKE